MDKVKLNNTDIIILDYIKNNPNKNSRDIYMNISVDISTSYLKRKLEYYYKNDLINKIVNSKDRRRFYYSIK